VADAAYRVELTQSFLARLDFIAGFLAGADAAPRFDRLLDELRGTVVPNLRRFPRLGQRYLDRAPGSAEALAALAALPAGAADRLREYLHDDFLILYAVAEAERVVHLLSIRHHRGLAHHDQQAHAEALHRGQFVRHVADVAVVRDRDAALAATVFQPLFVAAFGREQVGVSLDGQARLRPGCGGTASRGRGR
jgi:ParE toxin of type II toxin-antitoxin system, parDE